MVKQNFLNTQKKFSDATYDTAIAPVKYPSKCHYATYLNKFRVTSAIKS